MKPQTTHPLCFHNIPKHTHTRWVVGGWRCNVFANTHSITSTTWRRPHEIHYYIKKKKRERERETSHSQQERSALYFPFPYSVRDDRAIHHRNTLNIYTHFLTLDIIIIHHITDTTQYDACLIYSTIYGIQTLHFYSCENRKPFASRQSPECDSNYAIMLNQPHIQYTNLTTTECINI